MKILYELAEKVEPAIKIEINISKGIVLDSAKYPVINHFKILSINK